MPSTEMTQGIDNFTSRIGMIPPDLDTRRAMLATMVSQRPVDPGVHVDSVDVGVPAEWIWADDAGTRTAVLYCHGGGYTTGSAAACRPFAGSLSGASGARFLAIDYRLAPENPFPAAVEDALTAYRWLLDNGFAPGRIAVGGDSAGGGLGLATLVAAKDAGLPMPACAFAISPWTDLTLTSGSMVADPSPDPMANAEEWRRGAGYYLAGQDPRAPLASPLFADLVGLPPVHIEVGTAERLLDDSRSFVAAARAAGVTAEAVETDGAMHCFPLHIPHAPESIAATSRVQDWLRRWLRSGSNGSG